MTGSNVVATFSDMDEARKASLALSRAGIDGSRVSLLGRDVDRANQDPDTTQRDQELTDDISKKVAVSGAAGGVLGGLAGAAAFAIPGVGPAIGTGIWAAVAAGAVGGGAIGGMVGGVGSLDLNEESELTYREALKRGKVLLAVQADDSQSADKARKTIEAQKPESVEIHVRPGEVEQ